MLASRFVFLILGLGLGLALGLLLREEPSSGRALPPRVVREVVTVREPAPAPVEVPQEVVAAPVPVMPLPDPVGPGAVVPEDEGLEPGIGRLVVDFTNTDWPEPVVFVEGRHLEGERTRHEFDADDGVATTDLLAGTHTISWREGDQALGPRFLSVRIRAGWVTRVDAADPSLPLIDPVPEGLGRLEVTVSDLAGGPLPQTAVGLRGREFHGDDEAVDRITNESGRVRFDVLPGRYTLEVGLRSDEVVVRAGERATFDVRYRSEGEIVIEGSLPGAVGITAIGPDRQARLASRFSGSAVRHRRFVYLPPGEYLVTYQNRNRVAGRATVRFRQVTRFSHDPPPGGLQLRIVFPESKQRQHIQVTIHDAASGFRVGHTSNYIRDGLSWRLANLTPGAYRVRITGRTFETYEEEVLVGSVVSDWPVRLVPKAP